MFLTCHFIHAGESDLDECASAPCLNGGTCTDSTSPAPLASVNCGVHMSATIGGKAHKGCEDCPVGVAKGTSVSVWCSGECHYKGSGGCQLLGAAKLLDIPINAFKCANTAGYFGTRGENGGSPYTPYALCM